MRLRARLTHDDFPAQLPTQLGRLVSSLAFPRQLLEALMFFSPHGHDNKEAGRMSTSGGGNQLPLAQILRPTSLSLREIKITTHTGIRASHIKFNRIYVSAGQDIGRQGARALYLATRQRNLKPTDRIRAQQSAQPARHAVMYRTEASDED